MKRWIIRSFFIALLLLFVGGWVVSYRSGYGLRYINHNIWIMEGNWGKVNLEWLGDSSIYGKGWRFGQVIPSSSDSILFAGRSKTGDYETFNHRYILGFSIISTHDEMWLTIPFWFPTTISAAVLWLVWRKTRPRPRGFPVEVKQGNTVEETKP